MRRSSPRVMSFATVVRRERNYKVQLRAEILGRIAVITQNRVKRTFTRSYEIILLSAALRFVRRVFERLRLYGVDERFNCDAERKKKGGKMGAPRGESATFGLVGYATTKVFPRGDTRFGTAMEIQLLVATKRGAAIQGRAGDRPKENHDKPILFFVPFSSFLPVHRPILLLSPLDFSCSLFSNNRS